MSLETDCLLAVVGLAPKAITARDVADAAKLPALFSSRAAAWWTHDGKDAAEVEQPEDLDALFDACSVDPLKETGRPEVARLLASAGDDAEAVDELLPSLAQARAYFVAAWPRVILKTYAGDEVLPLAMDDRDEVADLWSVLNSAPRVLDELDAYTLTDAQAIAFRKNFPDLFRHLSGALLAGSAVQRQKDPAWTPSESQEIVMAIFTGQAPGQLEITAEAPGQPSPKPTKDLGAASAATQADLTSKPRSANK